MLEAIIRTSKKFCRSVILPLAIGSCSGSAAEYGSMADGGVRQKDTPQEKTELSPESWIDIGTRNDYACGLRKNGAIACWGDIDSSELDTEMVKNIIKDKEYPEQFADSFEVIGDYKFISESIGCGILRNGQLSCWRWEGIDRITKFPPGEYSYVNSSCAIREDQTLVCPDEGYLKDLEACAGLSIPNGTFTEVDGHCGLRTDGRIQCFEVTDYFPKNFTGSEPCLKKPRFTIPPGGNYVQLEVEGYRCGLREDGAVECWRSSDREKPIEPSGRFRHISIDSSDEGSEGVGIREDGTLEYWSDNPNQDKSYSHVPEGRFVRVASGGAHACAIREGNQSVVCWGGGEDGKPFMSPYE